MNDSRMSKYETDEKKIKARTEKHKQLYDKVVDENVEYVDINNAVEIDKINKENLKRGDYQALKDFNMIEKKSIEIEEPKIDEKKVYDINEILKQARENKENVDDKKRIINTEYNILTKLDVEKIANSKDLSKDNLRDLIDKIYEKEDNNSNKGKNKSKKTKKQEKELFEDLMETNYKLDEELSKTILDKEKNDEKVETKIKNKKDDTEVTITKIEDEQKPKEEATLSSKELKDLIIEKDETNEFADLYESRGKGKIIFIILLVLIMIALGAYLFLKYYGTL